MEYAFSFYKFQHGVCLPQLFNFPRLWCCFLQEVLVEEEGGFLQEGAISEMTVSGAVEIMVAGAMEEMILEAGVIIQVALVVISGLIKTGRAEVDVLVRQVWMANLRCDS